MTLTYKVRMSDDRTIEKIEKCKNIDAARDRIKEVRKDEHVLSARFYLGSRLMARYVRVSGGWYYGGRVPSKPFPWWPVLAGIGWTLVIVLVSLCGLREEA